MFADVLALPFSRREKGSALATEPRRRLGHVPANIVQALANQLAQVQRIQHRSDAIASNGRQPRGIVPLVQRPQSLLPDLYDSL